MYIGTAMSQIVMALSADCLGAILSILTVE